MTCEYIHCIKDFRMLVYPSTNGMYNDAELAPAVVAPCLHQFLLAMQILQNACT